MSHLRRAIDELQRRRVYRVAVIYAAVAFVIWQATEIAFPALGLPDWSLTVVVVLTLVGFPIALVLAWVFDITPEGVRRTEPLAPEAVVPNVRRRTLVLSTAAVVLVLSVAGGWLLLRAVVTPEGYWVDNPRRSIVILPFAVTAPDTSVDWLAEGAAAMLTTNLEGWRELRVEDRRRLAALGRSQDISLDKPIDLADGVTLAREARVGTLLMGDVLGYAGNVEIVVRMYDVASGGTIRNPARASGSSADPRPLMDSIAAQILEISGAPVVSPKISKATTNSLKAYQEYLEGRRHLYRWELSEAADRFRAALSEDSTFALAYYRLALALSLQRRHDEEEVRRLAAAAVRYTERLPWREKQHVRAFSAFQKQDSELARQIYRGIIAADSSDAEAWYHLGEVEYYDRILVQRSDGKLWPRSNLNIALRAFERAVYIDPGFHLGYGHSFEIYRWAWSYTLERFRDRDAAETEGEWFWADWNDSMVWVPNDAVDSLHRGDSVVNLLRQRYIAVARRWVNAAPDEARPHAVLRDQYIQRANTLNRALEEDRAFLRLMSDTTPVDRFRLANLHLVQGTYDTAVALTEVGIAALARPRPIAANVLIARGQPSRALEIAPGDPRGLATFSPPPAPGDTGSVMVQIRDESPILRVIEILGSTGANRLALRAALDSLRAWWSEPRYTQREIKAYDRWKADAIGPALLVSGDDVVRDWYARLSSVPAWARAFLQLHSDSLAASLTIEGAVASWLELEELAKELEASPDTELSDDVIEPSLAVMFGVTPRRNYLLANVAQALGRDSLAVELYERMDPLRSEKQFPSFIPRAVVPLPYEVLEFDADWGLLSLSYLERARSYVALGDTANAIKYYERFAELWRDAEPDLQHYAAEARQGLARLRGGAEPAPVP